jgi:hypothetical protein
MDCPLGPPSPLSPQNKPSEKTPAKPGRRNETTGLYYPLSSVAGFVWVNDIAMTSMDNLRLCDLLIDKPAN